MDKEKENLRLSRHDIVKSSMLFALHFLIMLAVVAVMLFRDKLGGIGEMMQHNAANYLYMIFCLMLLLVITYFYFYTENDKILQSGKTITLIFCVLDF